MIDKSVLKRLVMQCEIGSGDEFSDIPKNISLDKLLLLANACAEYGRMQAEEEKHVLHSEILKLKAAIENHKIMDGAFNKLRDKIDEMVDKSKCAAGEWLDYPEHKPGEGKNYLCEIKNDNFSQFQVYSHEPFYEPSNSNKWSHVKRFAQIN